MFMRYRSLVLPTLLLLTGAPPALAASGPTPPNGELNGQETDASTNQPITQLPRSARPLRYDLSLIPDAAALTFSGTLDVTIDILSPTSTITLNAENLAFESAMLMREGKPGLSAVRVAIDARAQTATLDFGKSLAAGRYHLLIGYNGAIQTTTAGLFAADYTSADGKAQRALFTQFENSDARRLLPCWDEPSYKAVFALTVRAPAGQTAVSNMPVRASTAGDGPRWISFADTPAMSTYLLFLGMGDFERANRKAEGVDLGVVTRRGHLPQASFALDSAAQVLPWYNSYFGLRYPLPKLDNVAGPGESQTFGAMENWGAIFTFERSMLIDPAVASERTRYGIFRTLSHEMAHQWFGNLVTMSWWDDLWLNEGFATWMEEEASTHFHPEWHADLDFQGYRDGAMDSDSLVSTHPIIQPVATVEEAGEAFDWITYMKGEAVVHMLETYVGPDRWRQTVSAYIRKHQRGNTSSQSLWDELSRVAGLDAVRVAHDFTRQPGVPLLTVSDQCMNGRMQLALSQGEWVKDRPDKRPLVWHVPVLAAHPGETVVSAVVAGEGVMNLPGCGPVIVNAGHHGYYRTLYSPAMFAQLAAVYGQLSPADQMGIMDDATALGMTGQQPMSDVLDLIAHMSADGPARIEEGALRTWDRLHGYARGDARAQEALSRFAAVKFLPVLAELGWQPKAGDSAAQANLRAALIEVLGNGGVPEVANEARRRYLAEADGAAPIAPSLRMPILRVVARNADQAIWDRLHAAAKAEASLQQKQALYTLLGRPADAPLLDQALDLSLSGEPGRTMGPAMIRAVSQSDPDRAVRFALAHEDDVLARLDSMSATTFIPDLASRSQDSAMIDTLKAYAQAKQANGTSTRPIDEAIASVGDALRIRTRIMPAILAWLDRQKI
jgi:aminopeptidase N